MPRNFTVIYTHPRGATATFIYQNGELNALAKGLDSEQFWVFKQVKALLLRNEDADLAHASQMMAEHGFVAQVTKPLPDLLAPVTPRKQATTNEDDEREYIFRPVPSPALDYAMYREGKQISEMHWREGSGPEEPPPPHRAPAISMPEEAVVTDATAESPYATQPAPQVSVLHWRTGHDQH